MDVTKNEYAVVKATYGRAAACVGEEKIFLEKKSAARGARNWYLLLKKLRGPPGGILEHVFFPCFL